MTDLLMKWRASLRDDMALMSLMAQMALMALIVWAMLFATLAFEYVARPLWERVT